MKKSILVQLLFFTSIIVKAQVGINTTVPNAQLDIRSSNQALPSNTDGILIPKVDVFPAANPTLAQQGMLVYLTTTSGADLPGFYYWNNPTTDWIPIGNNNSNSWTIAGNSGTSATTNFIGTTDNVDLVFRRFNTISGRIGTSNTFFGRLSGSVSTGNNNTYIGTEAGRDNVNGQQNVFIGRRSGTFGTTGSDNILIGNGAGIFNEANQNVFIGSFSGNGTSTGGNNTFMGYSSGVATSGGSQNAFFGASAGSANTTGIGNTILGTNTNVAANNLTNASAIGFNATVGASNSMVLGSINGINSATSSTAVGIGTTIPRGVLDVTSSVNGVLIPRVALTSTIVQAPILNPQGGPLEISTLIYNTATAGVSPNNVYPGFYFWNGTKWVRFDVNGENNPKYYTAVGNTNVGAPVNYAAFPQMTITFTPNDSVVIVHFSANGYSASSSCQENPVFFQLLLNNVPITGWQSTAENPTNVPVIRPVWASSMHIPVTVTVGISQTISINWASPCANIASLPIGSVPNGNGENYYSNRVLTVVDPNGGGGIVGTPPVTTNMWALNGNAGINPLSQFVGTVDAQPLVLKSNNVEGIRIATTGNVGIGTANPLNRLHVAGSFRLVDGTQAIGRVLTSDVNGVAAWEDLNFSAWGLTGNTGTNPATQFVGTADNQPIAFRTNNLERFRINEQGNIGIGTTNPLTRLEILDDNIVTGSTTRGNLHVMTTNPQNIDVGASITLGGYNDDLAANMRVFGSIEARKTLATNISSSGYLMFKTNFGGTLIERMRITHGGSVGIGTNNPLGQFELSFDQGRKPGTNTWTIVSDQRLKTINGKYTKGLNEILQLNPIRFNYKNNGERTFEQKVLDTEFPGFIAQEVQPIFPDAVGTDADGFLNFNIHPILIASVNAIKELSAKNTQLQSENQTLKAELDQQKALLESVLQRIAQLEQK